MLVVSSLLSPGHTQRECVTKETWTENLAMIASLSPTRPDILKITVILLNLNKKLNNFAGYKSDRRVALEFSNLLNLISQITNILLAFDYSVAENYHSILVYLLRKLYISLEVFAFQSSS